MQAIEEPFQNANGGTITYQFLSRHTYFGLRITSSSLSDYVFVSRTLEWLTIGMPKKVRTDVLLCSAAQNMTYELFDRSNGSP